MPDRFPRRCAGLLGALLLSFPGAAMTAREAARDPVSRDPAPLAPPASMASVRIPSGEVAMNGLVYVPGGEGPHPVAVLLHGLPGAERNLDLAHVLRRAGWAVVFFNYRGAWGSPGAFTFEGVLEDVEAVLAWTLAEDVAEAHGFDSAGRLLLGHNLGGFAALTVGATHEAVGCIASLAGTNLALLGRSAATSQAYGDAMAASLAGLFDGPLAGGDGAALVTWLTADADAIDLLTHTDAIAAHRVLLVAGTRDAVAVPAEHHDPLLRALDRAEADVTSVILDDDHAFSSSRVTLARTLTDWLSRGCR